MMFEDRRQAGRMLAERVAALALVEPVVLALPRGGVPVAVEVAAALHAPLDLLLVRKIGAPDQPELAVAALAEGPPPETVIDEQTLAATGATRAYVENRARVELQEIVRRRQRYLGGRAALAVAGKVVVVVDDGIATGTTVRAALRALRRRRPARVVLAVPVAPPSVIEALRSEVDDCVCLAQPEFFGAVGRFYADFRQVDDAEVAALLQAPPP